MKSTHKRLIKDLDLLKNYTKQYSACPHDDNLFLWEGVIYGPIDSLW